MYIIKKLERQLWNRKILALRQRYEYNPRANQCKHLKKVFETKKVYCHSCGISLEDQIGQNIVIKKTTNHSKWFHVSCSEAKNLL